MKPKTETGDHYQSKASERLIAASQDFPAAVEKSYDFAAFAAFLRKSDSAWVGVARNRDQGGVITCSTAESLAMYAKATALMLLLVVVTAVAGSANAADINGFRDMRFGDAPVKLGTERRVLPMPPIDTSGTEVCYARPSDRMQVGDAPVAEIKYCFYKDRLFDVIISTTKNAKSTERIRMALESAYGGSKEAFGMTFWGDWYGSTGGSIMMLGGADGALVNITSNDIKRQRSQDDKSAARGKL